MTKDEAIEFLESNKDLVGIAYWDKLGQKNMRSFGLGLTSIKSLARKVGRNHELAIELWKTDIYDAKVLAAIIDEPKKVTMEQIEEQVKDLDFWLLSDVWCSNLMPNVPFMRKIAVEWTKEQDYIKRRCAWLLMYQLAKNYKNLDNTFFEKYLDIIGKKLQTEENFVKDAMNTALLMIGQRNSELNNLALSVARKIGKVHVDYGENSCLAVDCVEHLSSKTLKKRLHSGH